MRSSVKAGVEGVVHPRSDFIGVVKDVLLVFPAIEADPQETLIRRYGNVAVAIGRRTLTMAEAVGSQIKAAGRYNHVFVAAEGRWCLCSAQANGHC